MLIMLYYSGIYDLILLAKVELRIETLLAIDIVVKQKR
jgi:hypothetical protein